MLKERFRFGDFFSRMWLENACRPRTLPVPVRRKRFLAPECVFIFGIANAQVCQTMKALYLLRHAKSSWDDPAVRDHDRPLAGRGRKAGAAMARFMAENGIAPRLVLCSTAKRTRQTLALLDDAIEPDEVRYEDDLYGASATELLERLRAVPDSVESVLVIGHNPGIQSLALQLADKRDDMAQKFPTGALAVLRFDGSWSELEAAELARFVRPRDLA